ncbi:MAG: selenide, water dikinase SelD [Pleurocapsa minor GSE-CHR-MK-17-07R]|nr:selenide, water dikinase SelD [Pleurocapsa minor GSE-CHR-MK 17-07R]
MLRPLNDMFQAKDYPALLVGLAEPDDAAVYKLNDTQAIVSTVDFFPPVVDDAYAFGAIAAANALSDIYAMGADPLFAINLAAFPDALDDSILTDILRGGAEKVREAGAVIAGGHTITDKEPKYGLAVTGIVSPDRIFTKGGARPGDRLVLTKPLGTGVITTALKRDQASSEAVDGAVASMMRLNRGASQIARRFAVNAATDITGFGLLGHAHEMAHLGDVAFAFTYDALPWLPFAQEYAQQDIFPGGKGRNLGAYHGFVTLESPLQNWQADLLYDPQTSGGLLLAMPETDAAAYLLEMQAAGESAWLVGAVLDGPAGHIYIR